MRLLVGMGSEESEEMSRPFSDFVLSIAEEAHGRAEGNEPESAGFRWWWRAAEKFYKLHYLLGLPWPCRFRHAAAVERTYWNADVGCVEEAWMECPRCEEWLGWAEDDPQGRGRV